ncbi:MAG: pilus assembly protein [Alphaproteobacteria bacterium]|nr:pilus assembly protein [Alphaproteobacteria bacterium]
MIRAAILAWAERKCADFLRDKSGLSAVEFAIILPFMLMLYLGAFEITQAIAVQRMVTLTASTVANIVTQYSDISASQTMPDILNASTAVLTPYPVANAVVTVSCISIDATGNAKVAWSQALNGSPRPVGQVMHLPAALDIPNTEVVLGETTYAYTPLFNYLNIGTLNLNSSVYMLPRDSAGTITLSS